MISCGQQKLVRFWIFDVILYRCSSGRLPYKIFWPTNILRKDNHNPVWLHRTKLCNISLVLLYFWSNLWIYYLLKLDSNIEDISRDAGSVDVDEDALQSKCTSYNIWFLSWSFVTNACILYERIADGARSTLCRWHVDLSAPVWNGPGAFSSSIYIIFLDHLFYFSLIIHIGWDFVGRLKLDGASKRSLRKAWVSALCFMVSQLLSLCLYLSSFS